MQIREAVVWHHREGVMFDVIVHVAVEPSKYGIRHEGAGIQTVVMHILGQAGVLRNVEKLSEERSIKSR